MFSVVFSSANQQLVIFNHTGIAVLFQQVIEGLHRSVWWCMTWVGWVQQGEDERGEKPPAHVERAVSCHRSTATIVGLHQTSRSSCCPAISAACAEALLAWVVNILQEVTRAMIPPVRWIPAFPLPHHPHKALMILQVTLHWERFPNPHAWLQKDTSPSRGQSKQ